MNATQAIKKIMQETDVTNAKLASRIGCSHSVVYERLTQQNISINLLDQMLSVLDYEIVVQPKTNKRRPSKHFVIKGNRQMQK